MTSKEPCKLIAVIGGGVIGGGKRQAKPTNPKTTRNQPPGRPAPGGVPRWSRCFLRRSTPP